MGFYFGTGRTPIFDSEPTASITPFFISFVHYQLAQSHEMTSPSSSSNSQAKLFSDAANVSNTSPNNRRYLWWFVGSSALIACSAISYFAGAANWPITRITNNSQAILARSPNSPLLAVNTTTLERVPAYTEQRSYTGQVTARRNSDLGFENAGEVLEILVRQGDTVLPNQPLAYLDTATLKARELELTALKAQAIARLDELQRGARPETIMVARASVTAMSEQLALANSIRERRLDLFEQGAISQENLDEAVSQSLVLSARLQEEQSKLDELLAGTRTEQIDAQRAQVSQIEANIQNLSVDFENSILKAPFAGTIALRNLDEGSSVRPGDSVLRIVENSTLEVHVGLPPKVAQGLQLSSMYPITIDDQTYQANITAISPELDDSTRTIKTILTFRGDESTSFSPGQVARLQIKEEIKQPGFWLPITALTQGSRGLWSVYSVKPQADEIIIERQDVEVLKTDGQRVFVRGTLSDGDQVVLDGTHRLVQGQRVQLNR